MTIHIEDDQRFVADPDGPWFWADFLVRAEDEAVGRQVFVRIARDDFRNLQSILDWPDERALNVQICRIVLAVASAAGFRGHELDARDWWDAVEAEVEALAARGARPDPTPAAGERRPFGAETPGPPDAPDGSPSRADLRRVR